MPGLPQRHGNGSRGQHQLLRRVRVTRRAAAFLFLCPPQRRLASLSSHLPSTSPCPAVMRPRAFCRWCRGSRLWPHRSPADVGLFPTSPCTAEGCLKERATRQIPFPPWGAPPTHSAGFPPAPPRSTSRAGGAFLSPFRSNPPPLGVGRKLEPLLGQLTEETHEPVRKRPGRYKRCGKTVTNTQHQRAREKSTGV